MNDSSFNSITYTVEKKVEGNYALKRALYIIGVVLASVALCAACIIVKFLVYFTPVMFMLCVIIFKYLFIYLQIEYRYTIEHGVFTMEKVFGGKKCKKYYEIKLSELDSIVPFTDVTVQNNDTVYDSCVSIKKPTQDLYAMIKNTEGKRNVACFEATKKTLKIMRYHNPNTVMSDNLRH